MHPESANIVLTGGKGPSTQTNWSFVVSYSHDFGATWTRCNLSDTAPGWCYALAVAPYQANVVYAAGCASGTGAAYRSTDFGVNWVPTGAKPTDTVYSLAVAPSHPDRVFAATPSGILLTTNAGASWTNVWGQRGVRAVMIDPLDQGTIFAGGDSGVSVSYDAGGTWTEMSAGLEGRKVTCLGGAGLLLAGTVGGSCYLDTMPAGIGGAAVRSVARMREARPNPFVACCRIVGHERDEFSIFDHSGRQVGVAKGDKVGVGLPAGVYFLRGAQAQAQAQAIGPIRIVKTK